MKWIVDKTVLGWLVVFKTPFGELWFQPDTYGNIRCCHSTLPGLSLDLQRVSAIASIVRDRFSEKKFGRRSSPERGDLCAILATSLNHEGLFPVRKEAA